MSDNRTPIEDKNSDERLGQYIKRARLASGVELADLAREIRVGADLLDHLENGRYDKLPVEAYVRGYLNSICNRLDLDRTKVLEWFAQESQREKGQVTRRDATLHTLDGGHGEKSNSKMMPFLFLFLVVLFFILMQLLRKDGEEVPSLTADSAGMDTSIDSATDSALSGILGTDSTDSISPSSDSIVDSTAQDSSVAGSSDSTSQETMLKFECVKDSTWIRVQRVNSVSWSRIVRAKDKPKFISHTDTMKVSVGSPEKTKMFINDSLVKVPRSYFKIFAGEIIPPKE